MLGKILRAVIPKVVQMFSIVRTFCSVYYL